MQFTITAWHRVLDPFQAARLLVQVRPPRSLRAMS